MDALVIVDVQTGFIERDYPSHKQMLMGTLMLIESAKCVGRKIIVVEFKHAGKTLPEIRKCLPLDTIWVVKQFIGGGKEILRAVPCLRSAELAGLYTTKCVASTAIGLAGEGVHCRINLDATADCEKVQDRTLMREKIEGTRQVFRVEPKYLTV
jgi:nicotinamidase-related amidase